MMAIRIVKNVKAYLKEAQKSIFDSITYVVDWFALS